MSYMTEERLMIQEAARQFTMEKVLPAANRLDPEHGQIPMEIRDEMARMGYFGMLIPEEYGGLGLGCGSGGGRQPVDLALSFQQPGSLF